MSLLRRLRNLIANDRHAREIEEEVALHIDLRTEENLARGMSPDDARQDAERSFGNRTAVRERTRDFDVPRWLDQLTQDLRYAVRGLRSSPSATGVLVLSLALGIGANTAMFTLTDALLLRTLPVRDPGELYSVTLGNACSCGWVAQDNAMNYALATGFAKEQTIFSESFAFGGETLDVSNGGEVRLVSGAFVSEGMWRTLGIQPSLGRAFTAADNEAAIISDAFWEREFQRDPSVLGRTIVVGGRQVTVIGVAPRKFFGLSVGDRTDLYLPIAAAVSLHAPDNPLTNGQWWWLTVVGRLRPGTMARDAASQADALSAGLMRGTLPAGFPKDQVPQYLRQRFEMTPAALGFADVRKALSMPLGVLTGLAVLLLLLACANIANLQLSRIFNRRRELAVRIALGASRARIGAQVLLESLLVSLLGAVAGFLLAPIATRLLIAAYATERNSLKLDLQPDLRILAFTAGLSLLTAVLFGWAPALFATQVAPGEALRPSRSGSGPAAGRVRRWLLGIQVTLAVMLTVGATLFSGTLATLMTQDAGFRGGDVLLLELDTARADMPKSERASYYRGLLERCRLIPGVQTVAASYVTPIKGNAWQADLNVDTNSGSRPSHSYFNFISPEFLNTFRTPIVRGRGFSESDDLRSPQVALVNQTFVSSILAGGNALGSRIHRQGDGSWMALNAEIVGVVKDARYRDLRTPPPPTVYMPMAQDPNPPAEMNLSMQVRGPLNDVTPALRRTMEDVNPKVGYLFRSFTAQVSDSLVNERAIAAVSSLFGVLALLLAAVGVYGIVSYSIVQRRAEIGIRMALGSTSSGVLRVLLSETAKVVLAGIAAGVLVAAWAAGYTRSLLYGLTPEDVGVYAGAAGVLALVAAIATAGPALRATRQDPMETLRAE